MKSMYDDLEKVLYSEADIAARIKEVAKVLDNYYQDKCPIMIAVLKGSVMFYADLLRAMTIRAEMDFMAISSYGNATNTSGEVKMVKDLDRSVEGRHIIIVEDIVDTGYTLNYLKATLKTRNPASVKVCSLLDKPSRRLVDIEPDYRCFEVGNEFVVGYGLDYAQLYRNLPVIGVLKEEVYSS